MGNNILINQLHHEILEESHYDTNELFYVYCEKMTLDKNDFLIEFYAKDLLEKIVLTNEKLVLKLCEMHVKLFDRIEAESSEINE